MSMYSVRSGIKAPADITIGHGYTEPFRRFVQRESTPQANEIPNNAASWLPGDDYYTDFHKGDPFIKVDQGFARLPGDGYAALHPELKGVDPEDYPDINKLAILADIAPYSREYNTFRQKVSSEARGNTELEIEFEKIMNRVKQTRESVIRMEVSPSCHIQNPSRPRRNRPESPSEAASETIRFTLQIPVGKRPVSSLETILGFCKRDPLLPMGA